MEYVSVDLGCLYLSVGFIPSACKMNENMAEACDDKKLKQPVIFNISFNTVEDVFRQINEKEDIEYLLDRVLKYGKGKKQPVSFPYLSHGIQ